MIVNQRRPSLLWRPQIQWTLRDHLGHPDEQVADGDERWMMVTDLGLMAVSLTNDWHCANDRYEMIGGAWRTLRLNRHQLIHRRVRKSDDDDLCVWQLVEDLSIRLDRISFE